MYDDGDQPSFEPSYIHQSHDFLQSLVLLEIQFRDQPSSIFPVLGRRWNPRAKWSLSHDTSEGSAEMLAQLLLLLCSSMISREGGIYIRNCKVWMYVQPFFWRYIQMQARREAGATE